MKTIRKTTGVAALVTAGIVMAGLAPQAAFAHKVVRKAVSHHHGSSSSIQSSLERRLQAMEEEIASLKGELAHARSESKAEAQATAEKISAHTQQVEERLAADESHAKDHHNLLFFRGGYAQNDKGRGDDLLTTAGPAHLSSGNGTGNGDNQGWYVGAGFDFDLTDNVWGLLEDTEVDGELMFEYKKWSELKKSGVGGTPLQIAINNQGFGIPTIGYGHDSVTVSQFTLSAAPKIKFNQLSALGIRPWVMPLGLALHVISPPSDGVTVFNPGMMFGGGMEYNIWGDLWAGFDARYHLTGGDLDGTNTDGFTAGGYVGFGF